MSYCSTPECNEKSIAKGLCKRCYNREYIKKRRSLNPLRNNRGGLIKCANGCDQPALINVGLCYNCYRKKRYRDLASQGLCIQCGCENDRKNVILCSHCFHINKIRQQQRREKA